MEEPPQGSALTRAIVNAILPSSEPIVDGAVTAIIDGDIDVVTTVDSNGVTQPVRNGLSQCVLVQPLGKRKKAPIKVPVLAGEVSAMLRLRHGYLRKNADNILLIRQDASNRVQALRREKDPMFVNLRNRDLLMLVEYSSRMYWLLSSEEMDMAEAMNSPLVQQRHNGWSSFVGASGCGS